MHMYIYIYNIFVNIYIYIYIQTLVHIHTCIHAYMGVSRLKYAAAVWYEQLDPPRP